MNFHNTQEERIKLQNKARQKSTPNHTIQFEQTNFKRMATQTHDFQPSKLKYSDYQPSESINKIKETYSSGMKKDQKRE